MERACAQHTEEVSKRIALEGLNAAERWWYGTPDWLRYSEVSGSGRLANLLANGESDD